MSSISKQIQFDFKMTRHPFSLVLCKSMIVIFIYSYYMGQFMRSYS